MEYSTGGRNSRNVTDAIRGQTEKDERARKERPRKILNWIKSNARVLVTCALIISCCVFNLDVSTDTSFPFKLFSISLMKYGVLGQMNIILAIIALCISLVNHILIDKKVLENAIRTNYLRITNYARDLNSRIVDRSVEYGWARSYLANKLGILTNALQENEITGSKNICARIVFNLMRIEVLFLWISLFWLFVSFSLFFILEVYNPSLVIGNFHLFSGLSTGFWYNFSIRAVPFLGILWTRMALRKERGLYFTNIQYFSLLFGYGVFVSIYNFCVYLSKEVWLYKVLEYVSLNYMLFHGSILFFVFSIVYSILNTFDKITNCFLSDIYNDFMMYGFDGAYEKEEDTPIIFYCIRFIFLAIFIFLFAFSVHNVTRKSILYIFDFFEIDLFSSTLPVPQSTPNPLEELFSKISYFQKGIWSSYQKYLNKITNY